MSRIWGLGFRLGLGFGFRVSPWSAAHLFVLLASAQNLPEAKRLVGLVRVRYRKLVSRVSACRPGQSKARFDCGAA